MSRLVLEIKNDIVKEKIVCFLQHFTKNELEIIEENVVSKNDQEWSDEYLEKNWKQLIVTSSMSSSYEDSDQYREDYGNYLLEKYK